MAQLDAWVPAVSHRSIWGLASSPSKRVRADEELDEGSVRDPSGR
jgi:hypothetical protein